MKKELNKANETVDIKNSHNYLLSFEECENSDGETWFERKFHCDGKLEYSDRITEEQYIYSLDYPDLFRMVEMFSMGFIPVNCQERQGDKCIWNLQGKNLKERPRGGVLSNLLTSNG